MLDWTAPSRSPRRAARWLRSWPLAVGLALAVAGCAEDPVSPAPGQLTALPRTLTSAEEEMIAGSNAFAFGLTRRVAAAAGPRENVFISPLSVSMALGMTMNGAAGETERQLRETLGFGGVTTAEANGAYRGLIDLLRSVDPGVDFRIANSTWTNAGFPVRPEFSRAVHESFDAEARALDFGNAATPGVINAWVNTATNGKIPTIVDQIDPATVMFLINAIYFKGSWRDKFDVAQTTPMPFTSAGGSTTRPPTMRQQGTFGWLRRNGFQVLDLPYSRGAFSMTVILPDSAVTTDSVLAALTPAQWEVVSQSLAGVDATVALPKLRLEREYALNGALQELGIRNAFTDAADFSRLSPVGGLAVSEVRHKTFVDVNEDGTEAAAVTSVGVTTTSMPQHVDFIVDRPFVFVIRERFSGAILFVGRIATLGGN